MSAVAEVGHEQREREAGVFWSSRRCSWRGMSPQALSPGTTGRAWPQMTLGEHDFVDDPTNWWIANHAGASAMLRSSGMTVIAEPGREIYIGRPTSATRVDAPAVETRRAAGGYRTYLAS